MSHGMTHGERHLRRALSKSHGAPSVLFIDHIRNGTPVSKWKLFIWSLNGLIPCMDDDQLRESFGEGAFQVLMAVATPEKIKDNSPDDKKVKSKRKSSLKKKKRRLMPQDYAWFLRESGKKYQVVEDPRIYLNSPRSGHKRLTEEEREQEKMQRLQDWWAARTDEISSMKNKAAKRRAHKKLKRFRESIFNRRELEALKRTTVQAVAIEEGPRTAFVRVKPELYEIIVCGECPVFIWKEMPGREDTFQPNAYGNVERVAIRPPGNSMKTPWAVFEIEWTRRKLREGITNSEWVWEVGIGDRVKDEDES